MDAVDSGVIHGYHAHINFDPDTRDIAVAMREELGNRFDVVLGRVWDKPVGPHVKSMFQIAFEPAEFAKVGGKAKALLLRAMCGKVGAMMTMFREDAPDPEAEPIKPTYYGRMCTCVFV